MTQPAPTDRTRLRRAHRKAAYDREAVKAILDAQPLAYLGVILDGAPAVFPTLQWRAGERVYIHGSRAGRKMRAAAGREVCLTAAVLDAWKLARSAADHSVNFRSVMVYGRAEVTPEEEKEERLAEMIEAFFPGRNGLLRPMTAKELKATTVLSLSLEEASAKIGTGPVGGSDEDRAWPVWAGITPVLRVAGTPEPDPHNPPGLETPGHAIPAYLRSSSS